MLSRVVMSVNVEASVMSNSNPAPRSNPGRKSYKSEFKKRLVEESHKVDSCYDFVTDKYDVKHYTLRKYYRQVSRGLPMYETSGRPAKLDHESVENIRIHMASEGWTKMSVHAQIRKEILQTANRRYPHGLPEGAKVSISKSSVRNWAATLIASHTTQRTDFVLVFDH